MTLTDTTIDVRHLGRITYVASQLLATEAGPVLLDTGPGSTLDTLKAELDRLGVTVQDLHAILLSHIHFDHAGATGLLLAENPQITVYVHELGAKHLIDPEKLVASATRIYGDSMDRLWGRFLPVPAERVRALKGGETIRFGNRRFEVLHTPGHAVHHVGYFDVDDRTAYIGDNGGINVPALPVTLPVSPPPDFNLEDWLKSLDGIEAWRPRRLFTTHYGFHDDPAAHLADLRQGLLDWTETARRLLAEDLPDAIRADRFNQHVLDGLADRADPEAIRTAADFSDFRASYTGLARYWKKKLGA